MKKSVCAVLGKDVERSTRRPSIQLCLLKLYITLLLSEGVAIPPPPLMDPACYWKTEIRTETSTTRVQQSDNRLCLVPPGRANHWSAIIGASHSKNYVLWEYGGYASDGVKQVAELGSPVKMEEEIRQKVRIAENTCPTTAAGVWWSLLHCKCDRQLLPSALKYEVHIQLKLCSQRISLTCYSGHSS